MPQLIRRGGEQMVSQGQGRVEFALSLERSFDLQKLGGQIIQLNSNSMPFRDHIDCLLCVKHCIITTANRKWVRRMRTECALMKEAKSSRTTEEQVEGLILPQGT